MKYLFINSVAGCGSTGKIAADQCRALLAQGHECILAYGRKAHGCEDIQTYRIGTDLEVYLHVLQTRLFDINGFGPASYWATKRFLQWVNSYDPDVIWLHNIHGYYLHVGLLFKWIKEHQEKEYHWTLHDCWSFTGHCSYFSLVKCEQWKKICLSCKQRRRYPASLLFSNVECNFVQKKEAFTGIKNVTVRTPSNWLAGLVRQSFLGEYKVEVVHNQVDKNIFAPTTSDLRLHHGLQGKKVLLAVSSVWEERKGLNDLIELAKLLDDSYVIIIVGLKKQQKKSVNKYLRSEYKSLKIKKINSLLLSDEAKKKQVEIAIKMSKAVQPKPEAIFFAVCGNKCEITSGKSICKIYTVDRTENQLELAAIYTAADFFINPSLEDNYPTVNLEAIACGTPVITYDIGGCKETIQAV